MGRDKETMRYKKTIKTLALLKKSAAREMATTSESFSKDAVMLWTAAERSKYESGEMWGEEGYFGKLYNYGFHTMCDVFSVQSATCQAK